MTLQGPFFLVSMQQRQVTVSSAELRLLRYLLARDGELVRGEDLFDLPGEDRGNIAPEELDHRVRFLRRKLENSGAGSIEILPESRYRFLAQPRPGCDTSGTTALNRGARSRGRQMLGVTLNDRM